jgi:hypothetical protein
MQTLICTWFVADDAESATFFPQIGSWSNLPEAQAVYWRCVVCFFASSLAQNPSARHVFFTNVRLPVLDRVDLAALFAAWRVEVVELPITYRLARGAVRAWGNQFYIFDILEHLAAREPGQRAIVLDSDCIWIRPVDKLADAIDRHGCLTYELDYIAHPEGAEINGLSREGMARFLYANGGQQRRELPYFGGEIYAARHDLTARISSRAKQLWEHVLLQGESAPREEAHYLSILYAFEDASPGTANEFIRRMWTTFHHNDLRKSDRELTIWHLPAEKRTGFRDLYDRIIARPDLHPGSQAAALGLTFDNYARAMGWPRRRPAKFARDLSLKVREKLQKRSAAAISHIPSPARRTTLPSG